MIHFEARYRQINQLLEGLDVGGFLELSSGFNFRCLELSEKTGKTYVDTDLPDLIAEKQRMLEQVRGPGGASKVFLRPLNVLDEGQFLATVAELPPGPVAIINEGLLVYFDQQEKERLCATIRKVLRERGGYWVTSDIYVRVNSAASLFRRDEKAQAFKERHQVDENKFASFDDAREFFAQNGFEVDQEETLDITGLSSYRHLLGVFPDAGKDSGNRGARLQTSWRLRVPES